MKSWISVVLNFWNLTLVRLYLTIPDHTWPYYFLTHRSVLVQNLPVLWHVLFVELRGERFNTLPWRQDRGGHRWVRDISAFFQALSWYDMIRINESNNKNTQWPFIFQLCAGSSRYFFCQAEQIERTTKQEVLNSEALVLALLGSRKIFKSVAAVQRHPADLAWNQTCWHATGNGPILIWAFVWRTSHDECDLPNVQKSPQTGRLAQKCRQDHSKKAHEAEWPWVFMEGNRGWNSILLSHRYNITVISR